MALPPYHTDKEQPDGLDPEKPREIIIPKKVVFAGLGVGLLLFFIFSGLASRGYESKTIRFANVSRISNGSSFGSKRVFLRKGQTFTVDYDVEVEKGGLSIRLRKYWDPPGSSWTGQVRLKQSGSGQLRIPIPETGVYHLWIRGLPSRDGYHVTYTVSWKAE